jgi:hypothetical protein
VSYFYANNICIGIDCKNAWPTESPNWALDNRYIINVSDTITFNETLLNYTIAQIILISNTTFNETPIINAFLANDTLKLDKVGGTIAGDLVITGNLTVLGDIFNTSLLNGSIIPSLNNVFTLGNENYTWNNIFGNINASFVQNAPWVPYYGADKNVNIGNNNLTMGEILNLTQGSGMPTIYFGDDGNLSFDDNGGNTFHFNHGIYIDGGVNDFLDVGDKILVGGFARINSYADIKDYLNVSNNIRLGGFLCVDDGTCYNVTDLNNTENALVLAEEQARIGNDSLLQSNIDNITNNITTYIKQLNYTSFNYNGSITYNGLVGYKAANAICNNNYTGSFLCSEFDVTNYVRNYNVSNNIDAWIIAGGPKYIPATIPVDDCNGFIYDGIGEHVGSYWKYNSTNGGSGKAINCQTAIPLSCCR